ncbi:hypothetical protein VE00_09139 [Pseudogymnoascus sp. WSF 3629]|nr:hypothetical protein VE00_09139 [Pseudogymnoascus sp. WSF 3629]
MVRLTNISLLVAFASSAMACVDFTATINAFNYATVILDDNGTRTCKVNSYGDNNGWGLNCNSGYSAYLRFSDDVVEYSTPHGSYTFATTCTYYYAPNGGSVNVCQARVFGC